MTDGSLPPVAILAGGLATRMRPMTLTIPKSMLEVAGEPFIAHQLRLIARQGIRKAVICAGYLSEQIEIFVGDGADYGLNVVFSHDGSKPLGTGGALRCALPMLGDEFFVTYGDSYLVGNYAAIYAAWRKSGLSALMTVFKNNKAWDTSNVAFDGARARYCKRSPDANMAYIDWGLSLMRAETLAAYPPGTPFDLSTVQEKLSDAGQLAGFEADQRFYEIGSPAGLADLEAALRA